ncbi:MAG: alpha/beta hydrolase-fold protein [Ginsengibacter sp.]
MSKKIIRIFIVIFCWLSSFTLYAQLNVTFILDSNLIFHTADSVFIAGDFNNWNPHDNKYLFTKDQGKRSVSISLPAGKYEFKMTEGNWDKVETLSTGEPVGNRTLNLSRDTSILLSIGGWKNDSLPAIQAKHTASKNVFLLDSAFYIPQLDRYRRIWIYLPPDYNMSTKRYPVLYMHDGQNLFDNVTSFSGEWGVDEFLDSMYIKGKKEVIVIGIDNGHDKRMNEYNPWDFQKTGKGEGGQYVDFLVNTLKPFIDKTYRTNIDKKNTFIAGSSMGGLISYYAAFKYPDVFGGAGVFSPSFWIAKPITDFTEKSLKKVDAKLFFYVGGKEGNLMVNDMKMIVNQIRKSSKTPVKEIIDPGASHNENAWKKWFPAFYEWTIL